MELLEKNLQALMIPRLLKMRRKHICIYDKEFPRVIILKRFCFCLWSNNHTAINFVKLFSKFYYRHSELIVKYNICLKPLLQQGISEPVFYGDLVHKFKIVFGKPNISYQFKKIIKRYKWVGYNMDIMRQSACLVVTLITVYSYGFLLIVVGQASDSMTPLT